VNFVIRYVPQTPMMTPIRESTAAPISRKTVMAVLPLGIFLISPVAGRCQAHE
jgi:hypothetical protein